ncbi:MAG: TetR/AcrR family transcriptional regulator [Phyllobacterium sp.]
MAEPSTLERLTKGQKTRLKLLAAAASEFAEKGEAARVSDMVARLGLTQPAFYRHFESKEHARVEVIEDFRTRLRSLIVNSLIPESVKASGIEATTAVTLVNMLHFLDENRNTMMVAFIQEPEGSATRAELVDLIAVNVKREIASGQFRPDVSAKLFAEIMVGIIAQVIRSPITRGRREKQGKQIAELLLNGAKAGPEMSGS